MPYRITRPDGLKIEVDTADELSIVLMLAHPGAPQIPEPVHKPPAPLMFPSEDNLLAFYDGATGLQQDVLFFLSRRSHPSTDTEMRDALDMTSNNQLGGAIGGLSRRAKRVGLSLHQILITGEQQDGTPTYQATDAMREAMKTRTD
jgi:hypothetical protein